MAHTAEQLQFEGAQSTKVIDQYANVRKHLTQLSAEHVEDAFADYLSPECQAELGLTQKQTEAVRNIAILVVREFAWDVKTGQVSLEPDTREEGEN
jgi:hypothetical protein